MTFSRTTICLIAIGLVFFNALMSIFALTANHRERDRLMRYLDENAVQERLGSVFSTINDFPGSAGKDMLFLRALSSLTASVASGTPTDRARDDLREFLERNSAYSAFFVHEDDRGCVLSVQRGADAGPCACASTESDVAAAVQEARSLPDGGVYVSPVSRLACTGTSTPVSAILYATRIGSTHTLTAAVGVDYFLKDIRRLARHDEPVYLLRGDGTYLAHPDAAKEWIHGGVANFYADYAQVPSGVLTDPGVRHVAVRGRTFTFLRITPTVSNFALYDSAATGTGEYWILTAVSRSNGGSAWWFSVSYLLAATLIILIHTLLAILIAMVIMPRVSRSV